MRTRWTHVRAVCIALGTVMLVSTACKKEEAAAPTAGADKKPRNTVSKLDPTVIAILAKADKFDGKEDKVVSKCASCALGMGGSPDHAIKVGTYKMHFCSAHCKEGFEKDTNKAILALSVPED